MRLHARNIATLAAFALASSLVVVLAIQNRDGIERYQKLQQKVVEPHAGLYVPTFSARAHNGAAITVGERSDGGRQLVYLLRSTCPYCEQSLPAWSQLAAIADTLRSPRVTVVGVATDVDSVAMSYATAKELSYPVVAFPSAKLRALYRANRVPATLVLDSAGKILFVKRGVLTNPAAVDSIIVALRWIAPRKGAFKTSPPS